MVDGGLAGSFSGAVRICSTPGVRPGEDWNAAAAAASAAAAAQPGGTTAVIGPRGAGKSTFVKWAVNRLLSNHESVFILDVDPGQTDTFLPCCLAVVRITQPMLAPPHAADLKPFSVHFYGHTSPAVDIDAYRRAVTAAADSACAAAAAEGAPLIVNTLGWVKGVGWGLTCFALAASRASVVVNMRIAGSSGSINSSNAELGDAALLAEVGPSFSCAPIPWRSITVCDIAARYASPLKGNMTPAATRALQLHSYLQPSQMIARPFHSMCVCSCQFITVTFASRDNMYRYLCTPGHDVHRSFMLYAVVGTVVALLRSDMLRDTVQQHDQRWMPFEICHPSPPVSEGGPGHGNGAYGVAQQVPPDAQVPTPFNHHESLTFITIHTCHALAQFVCMAVLTAVDMGARTFILQVPARAAATAHANVESDVSAVFALASANVLVKVGGLDPPPLGQPAATISSSSPSSSASAICMPQLHASPYETGLCIDKGSAGSAAGWEYFEFIHFRLTSLAHLSIFSKRAATAAAARALEVKSDYCLFPS